MFGSGSNRSLLKEMKSHILMTPQNAPVNAMTSTDPVSIELILPSSSIGQRRCTT